MNPKPQIYDLFNLFWSKAEMKDFKPQDGMTFFCMVHACNRQDWANPFSLSNKRAALLIGVSEKTLIECRARLQQRGLLQFRPGKRKQASPSYCLPVKDEDGSFYFPWESKTESKTVSKTESKTVSKNVSIINDIITDDIMNTSTTKPKPKVEDVIQESLFAEEEKKTARKKSAPKKADPPPAPPTIEAVKAYFEKVDAPVRIPEWERSAELFYDTYAEDGWVNKRGRSIVSTWESAANKWIFYREENTKKEKSLTTTNNVRPTTYQQPSAEDERLARERQVVELVADNLGRDDPAISGSQGVDLPF